jgi:hypothetical protein
MRHAVRAVLAAIVLLVSIIPALADNWVAVKLRGQVMQFVDKQWLVLQRGDVVPDDRVIRTMDTGRVQFQRGRETIDLGPQTQIRIIDKPGRQYTTVRQDFGSVAIEADVRNVEHFSVETPHLAAVVKGTKFVVTSGKSKASVKVTRGRVAVEDEHSGQSVVVVAGQTASTEIGQPLDVSGRGSNKAVVVDQNGQPVVKQSRGSSGGNGSPGRGNAVGNTLNSVGNTVNSVGNAVGNATNSVGNTVTSATSTAGDTVSSVGSSVGDAVGGSVGSTVSNTTEAVGSTVGAVGGAVGGLVGGLL